MKRRGLGAAGEAAGSVGVSLVHHGTGAKDVLRTARGMAGGRPTILIVAASSEGAVLGEAAPMPAFGTEDLGACERALSAAVRVPWMADGSHRRHWVRQSRSAPAARWALRCADLELCAVREGTTPSRLLHPRAAERVDSHVLVPDGPVPPTLPRGWTWKVKVGAAPVDEERRRLDDLRAATGGELRLRLDANGAWMDPEAAFDHLHALGTDDVEWIEQPLAPGRLDLWAPLAMRLGVAFAADEEITGHSTLPGLAGHAAVAVLKPHRLGGPARCLALARRGAALGLRPCVTHFLEGPWGRRMAAHTAAAVDAACPAEAPLRHGLLTPTWQGPPWLDLGSVDVAVAALGVPRD